MTQPAVSGNPEKPVVSSPSRRIATLLLIPITAAIVGDLLQGGGALGPGLLAALTVAGTVVLVAVARRRLGAAPWIGAAALVLAAGGLLLWGDLRAIRMTDEWDESVRPRLLRRAARAEVEFDEVLERLARPATLLAEQPFAGAYSTDLEASSALFDLVEHLRNDAGLASPRFGVDLLDSLGRSVAWSGRTSILPGTLLNPLHNRPTLIRVLDTRAGTRLLHLSQVGDSGNVLVVEYLVRNRFDRTLPEEFVPSLPRRANPSAIRFQDHRVSQAELDAVFSRRENRYWGADDRVLIFPLSGSPQEILAVVALRSRPPEEVARETRQRSTALATALAALALLGLLVRTSGPTNPFLRLGVRSGGLWLLRLLLAGGGFPAGLLDLRAFDFETFASPALAGLMRSPGDFLLTGMTLLFQAVLIMRFVRRTSGHGGSRMPPLAVPDGGLRTAALLGGLALLAGLGLHGLDRMTRHAVTSSNLDLLRLRLPELSIELLLLHAALLATVLAGALGLASVGWAASRLTPWGAGARPGPLGLPEGTHLRSAFLPLLVGAALVVYPLLLGAYQDAVSVFYQDDLMPRVIEHQDLHKIALLNTIEVLVDDVELAEQMASPQNTDFDELAFDRWSGSSLARQGLNSSIELLDVTGRVLGEFSLNMPRVRRDLRRPGGTGDIEREILQTGDQLAQALHGSRIVSHHGKTVGFIVVHVLDTAENLPFLSSTDPHTQFFRRPGRRPPEEMAYGVPILYDYDAEGAPRGGGTAPQLPALDGGGTSTGEWHRVRSPSGQDLDLLFAQREDGVYALGHRASDRLGQVGGFIRLMLVYGVLATVAAIVGLLGLALRRPGSLRPSRLAESLGRSYYRKLFVTFVVASLLPLLTLAVFLQGFIAREIRQELVVKGGQSLDSAARILTRITTDEVVPTVDDGVMDLIRNMVGADLHLYVEDRLLATSRRELITAGLLPAKLDGATFRDLYLEQRLISESRSSEGDRDVTLLASPVNLGDLREKAVLALHVHAQPGVLEAQVANVEDAILIATTLLVVLLAGTGFVGARLISAPILRMVTATRRLARGELDTRVHVRTRDETASLASSFNEMSLALKTRDEELRGHLLYIQTILENATTGVISLDERSVIVTINTAAQRLLQAAGPAEIGVTLDDLLEGVPALDELAAAFRRARRKPDEDSSAEVTLRDEVDRESQRLRAVFIPFEVEPGRPGQILLLEDITDVARSNRLSAWAEMARGIAHEIKNPLTPIQLAVGHLRRVYQKRGAEATLDEPRFRATLEECLDIILEQVEQLRQISQDFSSYARIPESRRELTDPADLIRSVLRPYTRSVPESIEFEEDVDQDMPRASLDPDLMRRTLVNLVENSLQAMPEGGKIRVSAVCTRANGEPVLEISVSDTGVGVEPDALKRLFEPYFSTKASGTGLGLAIARKAVEEHGGEISAESRPGSGTTFRIRIPVRADEAR